MSTAEILLSLNSVVLVIVAVWFYSYARQYKELFELRNRQYDELLQKVEEFNRVILANSEEVTP